MNDILINIFQNKEDYIIKGTFFTYQITSTYNQNYKEYNGDISILKLGECENKLKKYYNISEDHPLIIFKVDKYDIGLLIPIVEYEVYNFDSEKVEILNLEVCQNLKIDLFLPYTTL